jgi:death-on-curing protein
MTEPVWINERLALALHQRQIAEHGGEPGVRSPELLESVLARPLQRFHYSSDPDLCALAASYAAGLAGNHPFFDGNKRTAFVVYRLFLLSNGIEVTASREDRYLMMLRLAAGEIEEETFATWLRENTAPVA